MKKYLQTILSIIFAVMLSLTFFPVEAQAADITSGDWKYEVSKGVAYIKGYVGAEKEIEIPGEIDGYMVRGISKNAFKDNLTITSVIIPENIESIGDNAFRGCSMLSEVNFNAKNCTVAEVSSSNNGVFSGAGASADEFVVNFGSSVKVVPIGLFNTNVETDKPYAYITEINFSDSIEEIGDYAFEDCRALKTVTFASNIEKVGQYAFGDCEDLTTVVLNDALVTLDKYAFNSCDKLKDVTFGSNLTTIGKCAFINCVSLERANMQSKVTSIGEDAFNNCTSLIEVTIPEAVVTIESEAFRGTSNLVLINYNAKNASVSKLSSSNAGIFSGAGSNSDSLKVVFGPKVVTVPVNAFNTNYEDKKDYAHITELSFSNSVKTIDDYAFEDCKKIKSITFGSGVETIGQYAFGDCEDLESIVFNHNLTTIGNYAFYSCEGLKNITFGNYLTTIGEYAFANCTSLQKANMCSRLTTIGKAAFYNCNSLTEVTIPEAVTSIGINAFQGTTNLALINYNAKSASASSMSSSNKGVFSGAGSNSNSLKVVFGAQVNTVPSNMFNTNIEDKADYAYITDVVFSNSIKTIGDYAFEDCAKLKKITIGSNVETIGQYAFTDCEELQAVVFGNRLTTIGNYAFYSCGKLNSITWGKGLTTINDYAFAECSSLTTLNLNEGLTAIRKGAFKDCNSVETLTIPESLAEMNGGVFVGTSSLKKINFNAKSCTLSNIWYTSDYIFSGAGLYTDKLEVVFGNKVTSIPNQLFNTDGKNYAHITDVKVPANVTSVGNNAFANCKDLKKISFTSLIMKVGSNVFENVNSSAVVECYYGSGLKEAAEKSGCKYSYFTPAQPTVTSVKNASKGVTITWNKVIGAEGYLILRKTGNGAYVQVGKVNNATAVFTDASVSSGKTYTYTVQAYAGTKKSTYNNTGLTTKYLKTVTISSVTNGSSKITIKWKKVSGATKYMIYRSTGKGKYTLLKTVKGTSYTDKKSIKNGTKYSYKIIATDGKYNSVESSVKTTYYVSKASFTSKKSTAKKTITLKWKKNTKASGYQIMYSTSSKLKNPKYVKVSGSKKVSKVIKSLKSKKNYYICIRTYKTVGGKTYYSEWSTKVKVKTK